MAGGERHSLLCLWAMGTGEISPPDSKETPGSSLTIKLAALIQGLSLNKLEKESVFSLSPSFFSPSFAFCACLSVCLCLCVCVCVSECVYNQAPHTHHQPLQGPSPVHISHSQHHNMPHRPPLHPLGCTLELCGICVCVSFLIAHRWLHYRLCSLSYWDPRCVSTAEFL